MGYQVVELEAINNLIMNQNSLEIQVSILLWLIDCIANELEDKPIEVSVIKVEYLGAYPAIGIKYLDSNANDFELFVTERCEYILKNFSVEKLLQFMSEKSNLIKDFINSF